MGADAHAPEHVAYAFDKVPGILKDAGFRYYTVFENRNKTNTNYKNYFNLQTAVNNQRTSVSGVDEDEEALNLIKFQNAYNLASKVISVMAEMYDKLINETGV